MADTDWSQSSVTAYWDRVANRYLELFRDEMREKPFDLAALSAFAARLAPGARVLDVGCGPCAHVTRLLADEGLNVIGVDVSPHCIALARQEQPALDFHVMNMRGMSFEAGAFDGLVAFYVLHYLRRADIAEAIREFARVLRNGGELLLVAKDGSGEGWIDDPLSVADKSYWSAMPQEDLVGLLADNGFSGIRCDSRGARLQEIDACRLYLTATRTPR